MLPGRMLQIEQLLIGAFHVKTSTLYLNDGGKKTLEVLVIIRLCSKPIEA